MKIQYLYASLTDMIFAGLSQHLLPVLSQQGQDHMELEVVRLLMSHTLLKACNL